MANKCHIVFYLSHLVVTTWNVSLRKTENTHIALQEGVLGLKLLSHLP